MIDLRWESDTVDGDARSRNNSVKYSIASSKDDPVPGFVIISLFLKMESLVFARLSLALNGVIGVEILK